MAKYIMITDDRMILKDGETLEFNVENSDGTITERETAFWGNYTSVHAYQIDTDGTSDIEFKDGTHATPTQAQIDAVVNKYASFKTTRDNEIETANNNFFNSWPRVRAQRDSWLQITDKYVVADSPLSDSDLTSIKSYRTSLRNIPSTYSDEDPGDITFNDDGDVSLDGTEVISYPL